MFRASHSGHAAVVDQSLGRVVVGDDKAMQERLGDADTGDTLKTYTHVVRDQHRQTGDRLDEVFSSPPVRK